MKSKFLKLIAILCTLVMTLSFAVACTNNDDNGGGGGSSSKGRTNIKFLYSADSSSMNAWIELIAAYNNGQGKTDNVWVNGKYQSSAANQNEFTRSKDASYNVVMVSDTQDGFQKIAIQKVKDRAPNGVMLDLTSYANADADFQANDINEDTLNWYRMTFNTSAAEGSGQPKHVIGAGQNLIAVPVGSSAQLNAYSKKAFESVGVNIVSVPEDELAAYNTKNGASLQPHGYAEYASAPFTGAKSSTNLQGETVYKVFNNCISMNWEEQRIFLRYFTKNGINQGASVEGAGWNSKSPTNFGFVSEYWFNYGWSVGGDVMGFNGTDYDFTLLDTRANYIVVDNGVKIHNTTYNKGEIVLYEDRVNADMASLETAGKVYAIASQYDAVKEYVSLQLGTSETVDVRDGVTYTGYGVANPDTGSAENWLTNGTLAMSRITTGTIDEKYQKYDWIDFCPAEQYREYEGGSTYQDNNGVEQLKVIGKEYEGQVYTGALKEVNGTKIVGNATTSGGNFALAVPACSDSSKYQAAWDFISWVATEGQEYVAKTKTLAPVSEKVLFSDKYATNTALSGGKNFYAVAYAGYNCQRGDWGYFESGAWVTAWANPFNQQVRRGTLTLSAFESENKAAAKTALNDMYCVIKGIR